ncbi:NTP transferase domain-containing protein [Methylobacterium soli]|uniref:NTP transferase domain-containing protein n=2 Tax=Methylobacterium soli TaxID=553447 RepID=A0A6L3T3F8_9HYPH|nr:NTP transferase domain-containing protein [Methylobacterium soli]
MVADAKSRRAAPAVAVTQAVIMAGGKGTRLHPYSALFPKPLMPLNDMPILELLLRQLKNAGITDVILAVNHLSHLLEAFFGDGSRLGLNIRYRLEDRPLGTAGALASMLDELDDTFFVTNGDLLTTLSLKRMMQAHRAAEADFSIGVFEREVKIDFGLIELDGRDRMMAYREKPTSSHFVSMGVYLVNKDIIADHLAVDEYLDMPNLVLKVKGNGGHVHCFHEDCIWLDIGRPDDFALAQKMFIENRALFLEP